VQTVQFRSPSLNFPKTAYACPFITIDLRVPEAEGSFLTIMFAWSWITPNPQLLAALRRSKILAIPTSQRESRSNWHCFLAMKVSEVASRVKVN
jgi:hypothetical protein